MDFKLLQQVVFMALSLAAARAGKSMAAKMAMMAITTNNSMRVNQTFGSDWRAV